MKTACFAKIGGSSNQGSFLHYIGADPLPKDTPVVIRNNHVVGLPPPGTTNIYLGPDPERPERLTFIVQDMLVINEPETRSRVELMISLGAGRPWWRRLLARAAWRLLGWAS